MSEKVYFYNLRARGPRSNVPNKILQMLSIKDYTEIIQPNHLTAIKLSFGEKGSHAYIHPTFVRSIVEYVKLKKASPFLTDTITLYSGSRSDSVRHIQTAIENGFSYAVVNAPIIIADGLKGKDYHNVPISGKHFTEVKIASVIEDADSLVVASHFKGHEMSGFGGAIKNLAMGCSAYSGKLAQHDIKLSILEKRCIACGQCSKVCPQKAISLLDGHYQIDKAKCIGCGECLTVCQTKAVTMDWNTQLVHFNERLVEHAIGAVANKKNKVVYINFLMNICPDCDCCSWTDTYIVPDIGILISNDPVAIDTASFDLVNKQLINPNSVLAAQDSQQDDKFKSAWPHTHGKYQLEYAQKMNLGTMDYELITL